MASSPQSAAFLPALRDLDFALVQDIEERGADRMSLGLNVTLHQEEGKKKPKRVGFMREREEEA